MLMLNRNTDRLSLAARRLDGGITVRTLLNPIERQERRHIILPQYYNNMQLLSISLYFLLLGLRV